MVNFFNIGINEESYWNYFHIALQIEDMFNVISVKYPEYNFVVLIFKYSGHGKRMEGGLNAGEMSVRYGGSQQKIRITTINKFGTNPAQMKVGHIQSLTFKCGNAGPFYLGLKFDVFLGKKKIKRKKE